MMTEVNTTVWYKAKPEREERLQVLIPRKKTFSFYASTFLLYLYEMLGPHPTAYVSQTILLYALHLYSELCWLYLNKTGKICT